MDKFEGRKFSPPLGDEAEIFCHKNQSCSKLPEMDKSQVKKFSLIWRGRKDFSATNTKDAQNFLKRINLKTADLSLILGGGEGNFCQQKPKLVKIAWNGRKLFPHPGGGFSATKTKVAWNCLKRKNLQFQATLVFVAEKPPPGWGKIFWLQIYPFQAISSNFGFCGRKAPPRMRENFLTSDLSVSGNFEQLCFCGRKASPPRMRGKFFDFRFIHFRQFWATLVFVAEKPPHLRENFWPQIYPFQAILSNFGFCGRKAPPRMRENFWLQIYPFQAISSNFGFVAEKPPPRMRENFLTTDLSVSGISSNLVFVAEKTPPI